MGSDPRSRTVGPAASEGAVDSAPVGPAGAAGQGQGRVFSVEERFRPVQVRFKCVLPSWRPGSSEALLTLYTGLALQGYGSSRFLVAERCELARASGERFSFQGVLPEGGVVSFIYIRGDQRGQYVAYVEFFEVAAVGGGVVVLGGRVEKGFTVEVENLKTLERMSLQDYMEVDEEIRSEVGAEPGVRDPVHLLYYHWVKRRQR